MLFRSCQACGAGGGAKAPRDALVLRRSPDAVQDGLRRRLGERGIALVGHVQIVLGHHLRRRHPPLGEPALHQLEAADHRQAVGGAEGAHQLDVGHVIGGVGDGAAVLRLHQHDVDGGGVQVLNRDDEHSLAMRRAGQALTTFGLSAPLSDDEWGLTYRTSDHASLSLAHGARTLLRVDELPLAGLHNAANALAAGALCDAAGVPADAIARALRGFKGLPHRVEKINEIKKIEFFDDSKGTNVGATVAALAGMQQPVVLIAGGDGKGQDFSPLSAVVKRARAVVLIGRDAGLIERAIASTGVTLLRAGDMSDAVDVAFRVAQAGDAVLLSPACASYDMFRSYVHRAEVFVDAVAQLKRREG